MLIPKQMMRNFKPKTCLPCQFVISKLIFLLLLNEFIFVDFGGLKYLSVTEQIMILEIIKLMLISVSFAFLTLVNLFFSPKFLFSLISSFDFFKSKIIQCYDFG